jgi:hypothetical protein
MPNQAKDIGLANLQGFYGRTRQNSNLTAVTAFGRFEPIARRITSISPLRSRLRASMLQLIPMGLSGLLGGSGHSSKR